jgi:cobalt/nickel transport system ATP-binding protein
MKPLLEVNNLSYQYPDGNVALNNICLRVEEHESIALLGPNGSGKTTFLLHLNGTLTGKGQITIDGVEISKATLKEIRRKVGIVFQDPDEQLFMPTVLEDIMFGLHNLGWARDAAEKRALEALDLVGLPRSDAKRAPFHLSAGEKRRVALAGILVMDPKLLILDEPTSWLDPPGQRGLVDLLTHLPQPKLIATHDAAFAVALTNRAIFLGGGQILDDGPVERVVDRFSWRY